MGLCKESSLHGSLAVGVHNFDMAAHAQGGVKLRQCGPLLSECSQCHVTDTQRPQPCACGVGVRAAPALTCLVCFQPSAGSGPAASGVQSEDSQQRSHVPGPRPERWQRQQGFKTWASSIGWSICLACPCSSMTWQPSHGSSIMVWTVCDAMCLSWLYCSVVTAVSAACVCSCGSWLLADGLCLWRTQQHCSECGQLYLYQQGFCGVNSCLARCFVIR